MSKGDSRNIEGRLESLKGYLRTVFLVDGTSRLIIATVLVLIAAFMLDWWLRLPGGVRLVILVACGIAFVRELYRRVIGAAAAPLSIDDAAVAVEREYPSLSDRLISAVQLKREAEKPDALISRSLIEVLREDAEAASSGLDFRGIVEIEEVRNRAIAGGSLVVVLAVFSVFLHGSAYIAFSRFFNPFTSARWPYRTQLELEGGDLVVPRGEELTIAARAGGKVPKRAYLYYRYSENDDYIVETMSRTDEGRFAIDFKSVPDTFEYHVLAGDCSSQAHKVRVVDRPALDELSVKCTYPSYTGLSDAVIARGQGNVRAVVGTKAVLEAKANKVLDSAKLITQGKAQPVKLSSSGDGFRLELPVKKDGTYEIRLVGCDGFENSERYRYTVTAVPDEAPEVNVVTPGEDLDVSPNALVPIEARCIDEFSIKKAHIGFTRGSKEEEEEIKFAKVNLGDRQVVGTIKWDLSELDLSPGMVLSYTAVARDGHEPEANVGRSTQYHLRVLSAEEIAMRLEREKLALRNEVARIRALQEETGDLVDEVREVLAETDRFALPERQKAISAESSQSALGRRSGQAARTAMRIARDLENNRLLSKTDQERLSEVESVMSELERKDMPQASSTIGQARSAANAGERREGFSAASKKQEEIVDKLDKLLDKMQRWEKTGELLRMARKLLEEQTAIRATSLGTARTEAFRPPTTRDSLKEEARRGLDALVSRQSAAGEKMDALFRRMLDVRPTLEKTDPFALKNLTESIQVARSVSAGDPPDIAGRMRSAAANVKTLRWGLGLSEQDVAIDGLKRIVDILSRRQKTDWDKLAREFEKAGKKLDKMIKQEKGLRGETKGHEGARSAARSLADAAKKLAKITRDQRGLGSEMGKSGAEGVKKLAAPQQGLASRTGELAQQVGKAVEMLRGGQQAGQQGGKQGGQQGGQQAGKQGGQQAGKQGGQQGGQC